MTKVNGHTAEEVIKAIRDNHGLLAAAARDLGVNRTTVWRYVQRYPTIKAAVDEEREATIDFAESMLWKAVKAGNVTAIMFLLKTVGRTRGYVERQELQHEGGDKPLTIRVIYDDSGITDDNSEAA